MQVSASAGTDLEVRLVDRPANDKALSIVAGLLAAVLGAPGDAHLRDVVVTRISTGTILLTEPISRGSEWVAAEMRADLKTCGENTWLAKWGDPSTWPGTKLLY